MGYAIFRLKTKMLRDVDPEVAALEVRLEAKINKTHQTIVTCLQEIIDAVAAVRESQTKVWRAINGMSKEL